MKELMAKKLIKQAQYDLACKALEALGLNVGEFCVMTRALDIAEVLADPAQFEAGATLQDLTEAWSDLAYDDFASELEEAWSVLED
jgi:hypothetical protein